MLYVVYLFTDVPRPTLLGAATAIGAMIPFGAPLVFGLAALLVLAQGSTIGGDRDRGGGRGDQFRAPTISSVRY